MRSPIQTMKGVGLAALIALIGIAGVPNKGQAQGIFSDWFSDKPAGRHLVGLKVSERPGTILVSIGDRRLYKILPGNKAISYPIAIPDNEAFWAGTLPVSRKAVNPRWTPTASMRKENPALPGFCARWSSAQSAWRARAVSGQHALPHPWHRRPMVDRQICLERLYPHVQRRRDRPL